MFFHSGAGQYGLLARIECRIYLLHKQTSNFCPSVGREAKMGTLEPDDQEAGKMR